MGNVHSMTWAMKREKTIDLFSRNRKSWSERFRVRDIGIFGSVARNEDHPESDLDVLVRFDGPANFANFMDLKLEMEDLTGRRVDLVTHKGLRPEIRDRILGEVVHVP
jgi:predicted nucleotidyltransferase